MGSSSIASILLIVSLSSFVILTSSESVETLSVTTFRTDAAAICAKIVQSDICKDTVASFPVDSVKMLKADPLTILSMHLDKAQVETEKAIGELKALSTNKTAMEFAQGMKVMENALNNCFTQGYPSSLAQIKTVQKKLASKELAGIANDVSMIDKGYRDCGLGFGEMLPFQETDDWNSKMIDLSNTAVDLSKMINQ